MKGDTKVVVDGRTFLPDEAARDLEAMAYEYETTVRFQLDSTSAGIFLRHVAHGLRMCARTLDRAAPSEEPTPDKRPSFLSDPHWSAAMAIREVETEASGRLTRAKSALENWGRHFDWCATRAEPLASCNCGLLQEIAALIHPAASSAPRAVTAGTPDAEVIEDVVGMIRANMLPTRGQASKLQAIAARLRSPGDTPEAALIAGICCRLREAAHEFSLVADEKLDVPIIDELRRLAALHDVPARKPHPSCPSCARPLQKVRYEGGYLNEDQFDSIRAGDWFCENCPNWPNHRYRYFWDRDLRAALPSDSSPPKIVSPQDCEECDGTGWAGPRDACLNCGPWADSSPETKNDG